MIRQNFRYYFAALHFLIAIAAAAEDPLLTQKYSKESN